MALHHSLGVSPKNRRLTDEQVRQIKRRFLLGHRTIDIAGDYNMSPAAISKIRTGAEFARIRIDDGTHL